MQIDRSTIRISKEYIAKRSLKDAFLRIGLLTQSKVAKIVPVIRPPT